MYSDEFLDQWGEDLDREREQRERDCFHRDASEEPIGQIHYNGAVEIYLVCNDCGMRRPTGRYDHIL